MDPYQIRNRYSTLTHTDGKAHRFYILSNAEFSDINKIYNKDDNVDSYSYAYAFYNATDILQSPELLYVIKGKMIERKFNLITKELHT